jgi:acyl dehydratase
MSRTTSSAAPAATRRFEDVRVGTTLPELAIEITTSLIVAGALASRDYTPVHHDKSVAQRQGLQDVIMNILTTNGLVGRYVTDWAGPDAIVKGVAIKLGAPNLPGDTMKLTGTVAAKDAAAGTIRVEVTGTNRWGDHVTGRVTVALPAGA